MLITLPGITNAAGPKTVTLERWGYMQLLPRGPEYKGRSYQVRGGMGGICPSAKHGRFLGREGPRAVAMWNDYSVAGEALMRIVATSRG